MRRYNPLNFPDYETLGAFSRWILGIVVVVFAVLGARCTDHYDGTYETRVAVVGAELDHIDNSGPEPQFWVSEVPRSLGPKFRNIIYLQD